MNWEQIKGNWKQFAGQAKQQWGKLTDDDLAVINGKREELAGRIQTLMVSPKKMLRSRSRNLKSLATVDLCSS